MMEIHNWGGVGMIVVGVMILVGSSFIDWVYMRQSPTDYIPFGMVW